MWLHKSTVFCTFCRHSDVKQMDFAEQVESVAYVICGEELITFDKFCQIWHVKGVSAADYPVGLQDINWPMTTLHRFLLLRCPFTDLGQIVPPDRHGLGKSSVYKSDYGVRFKHHECPAQVWIRQGGPGAA